MKKIFFAILSVLSGFSLRAQVAFPVKEWAAPGRTPFVFYLSGDGGFNRFSMQLCTSLNKSGYTVTALNSRGYFWDKKTPQESTIAITTYLRKQLQNQPDRNIVLIGYSFGADVLPCIVNLLPANIKARVSSLFLLSPSGSTDFEVHLSDMLGSSKKRSMDVVQAINQMQVPNTIGLFGNDETDFPTADVKVKNFIKVMLPGGHYFNGDMNIIATALIRYLK